LEAVGADISHTLFVGSGPLPLSTWYLAKNHLIPSSSSSSREWSVINLDQDLDSHSLGYQITASSFGCRFCEDCGGKLEFEVNEGGAGRISFLHASAKELKEGVIGSCSVVILAALVGIEEEEKVDIAVHLLSRMSVGAHLLLRSVEGLRRLVYPIANEEKILEEAKRRGVGVELVCFLFSRFLVVGLEGEDGAD